MKLRIFAWTVHYLSVEFFNGSGWSQTIRFISVSWKFSAKMLSPMTTALQGCQATSRQWTEPLLLPWVQLQHGETSRDLGWDTRLLQVLLLMLLRWRSQQDETAGHVALERGGRAATIRWRRVACQKEGFNQRLFLSKLCTRSADLRSLSMTQCWRTSQSKQAIMPFDGHIYISILFISLYSTIYLTIWWFSIKQRNQLLNFANLSVKKKLLKALLWPSLVFSVASTRWQWWWRLFFSGHLNLLVK